jgi:predicted nucleic acid-binding protein
MIQELEYGAAFLDDEETRRKVRNISRMYPTVELTSFDHRRAGQLHARADRASTGDDAGIDDIDAMIAAVATRLDEPILTENTADFEAMDVTTESWD